MKEKSFHIWKTAGIYTKGNEIETKRFYWFLNLSSSVFAVIQEARTQRILWI